MTDMVPLRLSNWAMGVQGATLLLTHDDASDKLIGTVLLGVLAPADGWAASYVPAEFWQPIRRYYWETSTKDPEERLYREFQAVAEPLFAKERAESQEA